MPCPTFWEQVQDLHRAEFVRRSVQLAEGVGSVLPGARLHGSAWELPGPPRDVHLDGRGLLLLPTCHRSGGPLLSDLPSRPAAVTYPAGPASSCRGPAARPARGRWAR
ncbi:hypothetical protein ACFVUY_30275 [Kitasatospora sp. NPDC058063]|uniref:hypothetical protein n=1 Tax=unclassified Kitasatospora TaxID=2633591 RepID=UPI0036D7CAE0